MSFPQDLPHPSSSLAMTTARNQKSSRPDPPTPIRTIQTVSKDNKRSSTTCSYTQSTWDGKQRHRSQGMQEKFTSKDSLSCQRRIIDSPTEMANRHFRSECGTPQIIKPFSRLRMRLIAVEFHRFPIPWSTRDAILRLCITLSDGFTIAAYGV